MNYFSHDYDSKCDIKIAKMMTDYGYKGLGYYWTIVEQIYKCNGEYSMQDLKLLANYMNVPQKKLNEFIDKCINKYTEKDTGLFVVENNFLTSKTIKRRLSLRNKREKSETNEPRKEINGVDFVNLTEEQYRKLTEKYGEKFTIEAVAILDNWLAKGSKSAKQYIGKNHYAHFRTDSWLINRTKEQMNSEKANWSI